MFTTINIFLLPSISSQENIKYGGEKCFEVQQDKKFALHSRTVMDIDSNE